MKALNLIPQPRKLTTGKGAYATTRTYTVGVPDQRYFAAGADAASLWGDGRINISVAKVRDAITIKENDGLGAEQYRLKITEKGVTIECATEAGAFYGIQTLSQILDQSGDRLPCLSIDDYPDFAERGMYLDLARGRVPTIESLLLLADTLAHFKINQLQLYIEHTFAFRGHPDIGKGASPISADDILCLDAFCRKRHIELVPSLASFGHMATILKHPQYRHLAEDRGVGDYKDPDARARNHYKAWTIVPGKRESYDFLDSLFSEFLPLFSSKRFNVCCDETWDLGTGQSYDACKKRGKGRVYLDHILKLRTISKRYGKKIMFWGDIIRDYPELVPKIPKDVILLDWGYSSRDKFSRVSDFKRVDLPFYVCPGTRGWVSLFPQLHESAGNIMGYAAAGKRYGAVGLLNTDWGDGGHYNFMEYSWFGYLVGAEQSWNTKGDYESFTKRFVERFLGSSSAALVKAVDELGELNSLDYPKYYESIWQHIYFAPAGDALFSKPEACEVFTTRKRKPAIATIRLNSALGRKTAERTTRVRDVLTAHLRDDATDPYDIMVYWIFACDTLIHAGNKLAVLGPGGKDTKAARRKLKREMTELQKRFETLWMARNERSEIRITLNRYRKALRSLG